MSMKRRDKKGRILHTGESQRPDGRYSFAYTDFTGRRRYIYSNRLDKNDKTPDGCNREPSLREKEAELLVRRLDGTLDCGGDITVYELVKKYVSLKVGVRDTTRTGYKTVLVNDSKTRNAISRKQERAFLQFIKEDKHFSKYYEGFYILFNTGLRISEFCALTPADIDFKNRCIHVTCQMVRHNNMITRIEPPKTEAGVRDVPMSDEVMDCFRTIMKNQAKRKIEPMVDGKAGFLYLDKDGHPTVALHWEHYFKHVVEKYNNIYKVQLPSITPHVCRHTFCSKMAKSGMNPKTLQYIMGHSDIAVTMNTYTHLSAEDAQAEFHKIVDDNRSKEKAREVL